MHQESAWDLEVLNSGLLGSVIGVIGAFAISVLVMLYSLWRTEKANRTVAFESAMLKSAEDLAAALVRLRYKLDPLFAENFEHALALGPVHVVDWTTVSRAHANALAVDRRPYARDADRLTEEIHLFTAAVQSAVGETAETRLGAYGWYYERDAYFDSFLQAADQAMAKWADAILDALARLRLGQQPQFERPRELELFASSRHGGMPLDAPHSFAQVEWFPLTYLSDDLIDSAEGGSVRPATIPDPFA